MCDILCVDTTKLNVSETVQKDIKLEDILDKYIRYFDSVEDALRYRYAPLNFCTSIRTVYTNMVVASKENDRYKYYTNLTNVRRYIHKKYDLMMYLSAVCFMSLVTYKPEIDDMMEKSSTFMPIGLYNPDPDVCNPVLLSHVIIGDECVDFLRSVLRPDVSLMPLSYMRDHMDGNAIPLCDTLIDIHKKGE